MDGGGLTSGRSPAGRTPAVVSRDLANLVCDGSMDALADSINSYLQSVTRDFTPVTSDDDFTIGHDTPDHVPDSFIIHVQEVERNKLSRINTSKAMGPDDIPSWIWKDCASAASATSLCSLQQQSEGRVRTNYVEVSLHLPIPKVNPPTQLEKHIRPISLTPVLTKVMESFTCKWIMECISEDIDPHQYGSVKGSSTVHALVELVHLWQQALDEPGKVLRGVAS